MPEPPVLPEHPLAPERDDTPPATDAVQAEDEVEVAPGIAIPATAEATAREESMGVFWALVVGGLFFIGAGWMLPWFTELTSNGIGFSLQDVVSSPPTGFGTILVYVIGIAMVALIAGAIYDGVSIRRRRGTPFRYDRIRGILAAAGAISTLLIWYLIGVQREESLFGDLSSFAKADNAIWMALIGFIILALVYGFRDWVTAHASMAFAGVVFMVGALLPLIFGQSVALISWGASAAAIYVLLAMGLNVVVGFAGLLDLGYAAFFAIGAYTCGSLASPKHGLHWPFWIVLFVGLAVAALFGFLLGAPTLRLRGDYLAIVTLGFGEIVPDVAQNDFLHLTGGPNGITGIDHPTIFGYNFGINPRPYYWSLLVVIGIVILLLRNIERSRLGRAWVAIREDEVAAAATGINTVSTKLLAFAIGASVSGLAGAFYGAELGIVSPDDFQFAVSVTALTTVVLGGIGNNTGAAVGGILVSFIIFWILPHMQEWMGTIGHTTGVTALSTIDYSKFIYIVYGVILIFIMLVRPAGLLPSKARKVELQTGTESEPLAAVQGTV